MRTIEIIPGSEIPQDQVTAVEEILVSEGLPVRVSSAVYIRKAEGLPPILVFALGTIAGGLLSAVGHDTWEALKRAVPKTVQFVKKKWGKNPEIQLQFKEEDSRIIANFPTEDDDLIQEAINKPPDYLDKRPKGSAWMWFDKDSHEWKES